MKLSVSVPDELWSEVMEPEGSPSEVVQQALTLLAQRKHPHRGRKWAGDTAQADANRATLELAVTRLREANKNLEELGYRAGAALAADETVMDLDWLRKFVLSDDPMRIIEDLNSDPEYAYDGEPKDISALADRRVYDGVLRQAASELGWTRELAENEPIGAALPEAFLVGIINALFDVWRAVEGDSFPFSEVDI